MHASTRTRRAVLTALAALVAVTAVAPVADAAPRKKKQAPTVTVMTRNIYLGGDIFRPIPARNPAEFERLAGELWSEVQHTNFPVRSKLLAKEIKRTRPDLIGLQEVALWRRSPDGVKDGQATPSTQVVYDFLRILRRDIKRQGLNYVVGTKQREADIEGATSFGYDVRLTMYDVILVKKRKDLRITKRLHENYETDIAVPTQGGTLTSTRGWTAVDGRFKGRRFRFVNTHLEAFLDPTREAQARELVAAGGPVAGVRKPLIVVGDMNSDPEGRESAAGAFDILAGAGLVDAWPRLPGDDPGYSCCLANSDMSDTTSASFDHRIDLILTRPRMKALRGQVVGDEVRDRASNGLWPSDHAGVVIKLRLPKGR